jgi:flagella basal body P-ring formation protein FlgA
MMLALLLAFAMQPPACHVINSDRIYARDLAAAIPLFSALAPNLEVGFAPAPGLQRVFHPVELRRIARANHLEDDISEDACFQWSLVVPAPESMLAAMKKALGNRNPEIEFIDQSSAPAPAGELVFPLSGLSAFSDMPVVWRGYVVYALNRRFSTWARVRITIKESRVVAAETLLLGEPVSAGQLRTENYVGPLLREAGLTDVGQVIGMIPTRTIESGSVLMEGMLTPANEVRQGDIVQVSIQVSNARVEAQGIAEESGRRGAVITIRNAKSGRKFRARIEDKDKVVVVPGGESGLAVEEKKS